MSNNNRKDQEKKRIPVQASSKTSWGELDPNYYYRGCADYDKGKLNRYIAAGYEFVTDENGERVKRPGKDPVYLMRLPKKLRQEDLLAKKQKVIKINRQIQSDHAPKGGQVPEYIPKGQDSFVTRDDL
jgi:hypothetical protein